MSPAKVSFVEERFGPYVLVAHLGRGGMADVYMARFEGPGGFVRQVALKKIVESSAQDPSFIEMLVQEAKTAAQLQHPNIIYIYNLGVVDGTFYIEMEYVHGADLLHVLRRALEPPRALGLPPPLMVAYVGRQVARGLSAAHEFVDESHALRPVIHCDVSLQNVMVGYDGRVKLIDFGLAKVLSAFQRSHPMEQWLSGKLGYMAPEQIKSGVTTPQTDIFATAVVLYQLLTGRRPFRGPPGSASPILVGKERPVPPAQLRSAVSRALSDVVMKALDPDPAVRYQRAADLARDLDNLLREARFSPASVAQWMKELLPLPSEPVVDEEAWEEEYIEVEIAESEIQPVRARPPPIPQVQQEARATLQELQSVAGFLGVALVDTESGQCWCSLGGGAQLNMAQAALHGAEVLKAKHKAIQDLSLDDSVEDMVVTLAAQYHILRPVKAQPRLFVYLVLDRDAALLALASFALAEVEARIVQQRSKDAPAA